MDNWLREFVMIPKERLVKWELEADEIFTNGIHGKIEVNRIEKLLYQILGELKGSILKSNKK